MKLKDLFKDIEIIDTNKEIDMNTEINHINYHTDSINKNDIFVAIKGYVTDGHKYIPVAIDKGASIIVVEDFQDLDIPQIKVKNTRKTLADLANNYYNRPSEKLSITGITATNGKTTTSFMVDEIYRQAGFNTGIIGTVLTRYSDIKVPSILTTPESLDLQRYFSDMIKHGVEKVTMEVSSSAEELSRVRNIDFNIVTFNNFSREHIDQHGSFERYYEVKSKLIRDADEKSVAVLNMDFDKIAILKDNTKAKVLTYSLENDKYDFGIKNLDLSTGKGKFTFCINNVLNINGNLIDKCEFDIELGIAGYSGVMNAVVAIIIGLIENIDIKIIQKAIKEFSGVERRFEMIYDEDFQIIDDHYANSRNIDVTLSTLSKMNYKNLHVVYAIRGSRGVNLNRETAEKTAQWFKKLKPETFLATLSEDTVGKKDMVTEEEKRVFLDVMNKNKIDVKLYNTLEESVRKIIKCAKKGDVILMAGCQGMDKGAYFAIDEIILNDLTDDSDKLREKLANRIC